MKKERNAIKAGVFMLISIALVILVIIGITGGLSRVTEKLQARVVMFKLTDDIGGLRVGDDVRIGGFKVGAVKAIDVAGYDQDSKEARIKVTYTMPEKFVLREGAVISVQTGVTGNSLLNIEDFGSGRVLASNEPLTGHPSWISALAAIAPEARQLVADARTQTLPKVNATVDTFKETGQTATGLIKHVDAKIDPAIGQYNKLTDRGSEMMTQVRDLVGDTKLDFRETMANVSAATGTVKERLPGIMSHVDTLLTSVQDKVDATRETVEDVKKVAANAKDITASIRSVVTGNRGKLDAMVASLKTTGDNLKAASSEIRRSPWRLLYKPKPGEVANLNLYDSARQFSEGASAMNDAATALRDALKDPNISQEQVSKLVEKLDASFNNFNQVEAALWSQVKE